MRLKILFMRLYVRARRAISLRMSPAVVYQKNFHIASRQVVGRVF